MLCLAQFPRRAASTAGGSDWQVYYHQGYPYWSNAHTGETTWKQPLGAPPAKLMVETGLGDGGAFAGSGDGAAGGVFWGVGVGAGAVGAGGGGSGDVSHSKDGEAGGGGLDALAAYGSDSDE